MLKGSRTKETVHLVEIALASVGIKRKTRKITNWVGTVVDGGEISKLDFHLISALSGKKFERRRDLPMVVPLVWDPCHQLERIFKRLFERVPFLTAQLVRLSELRSIFSLGVGKYQLMSECGKEGAEFFVAKKEASTRWIAHQEKTFQNHIKTLPQQVRRLLKTEVHKKKRKALANELRSVVNVSLTLISMDCVKPLREMSISGQDQDQVPWDYPRKAEETLATLKAMQSDLKSKLSIEEKFLRFGKMFENISIFDELKLEYKVNKKGVSKVKSMKLNKREPTWAAWRNFQPADDESSNSSTELEKDDSSQEEGSEEESISEEILLTTEEHAEIRNFEADLSFQRTGIEVIDMVIGNALSMLEPLIQQFEICIMKRIPPLFKLLRECFDFQERFELLDKGDMDLYLNHNMSSLVKLGLEENKFLKLVKSSTRFDGRVLKKEARVALRKLADVYQEKKKDLEKMKLLIKNIDGAPEDTKAGLKRKLKSLEADCWWVRKGKRFELQELRVVRTMRLLPAIWEGNHSYMRLLTRGAVRKPSEAVVEQLISVINRQTRENLDWNKLVTEVQFRTFGPYAHEWDILLDKLYSNLHTNKRMRCMILHPKLRKQRNPHLKGSVSTTRLRNRKSKFQGFNSKK